MRVHDSDSNRVVLLSYRGEDGLDELSPSSTSYVTEVTPQGLKEIEIEPEMAHLRRSDSKFLAGQDAAHNAKLLR